MSPDTQVRIIASMMASAVFFGVGAILVLAIPALAVHAAVLLPVVIAVSFLLGALAGAYYGPQMRARYWRRRGLIVTEPPEEERFGAKSDA
ncbi:MAG: hypothetical protein ACRCXM_07555 [Beijerinckiaceae bacterium]